MLAISCQAVPCCCVVHLSGLSCSFIGAFMMGLDQHLVKMSELCVHKWSYVLLFWIVTDCLITLCLYLRSATAALEKSTQSKSATLWSCMFSATDTSVNTGAKWTRKKGMTGSQEHCIPLPNTRLLGGGGGVPPLPQSAQYVSSSLIVIA